MLLWENEDSRLWREASISQLLADQSNGKKTHTNPMGFQWIIHSWPFRKNIIPINLKYKNQSKTSSNNPDSNTHDHTTN